MDTTPQPEAIAAPEHRVGAVEMDQVQLTDLPALSESEGFRQINARLAASQQLAEQGLPTRIGGVEMDSVALIQEPRLAESSVFKAMEDRLHSSEAVVQSLQARGEMHLDLLLTETLNRLVADGGLDGLMIGSDEGFVVAQSANVSRAELLAAIGTVFEFTVRRVQGEQIIPEVEEVAARGRGGEQVVMRYFPGLQQRFFLVAYAKQPSAYRRTTARALRLCGEILSRSSGQPAVKPPRPIRRPAAVPATPPAPAAAEAPFPASVPVGGFHEA